METGCTWTLLPEEAANTSRNVESSLPTSLAVLKPNRCPDALSAPPPATTAVTRVDGSTLSTTRRSASASSMLLGVSATTLYTSLLCCGLCSETRRRKGCASGLPSAALRHQFGRRSEGRGKGWFTAVPACRTHTKRDLAPAHDHDAEAGAAAEGGRRAVAQLVQVAQKAAVHERERLGEHALDAVDGAVGQERGHRGVEVVRQSLQPPERSGQAA